MYSRFAWAFPLKSKSGEDVVNALEKLTDVPKRMQSDNGLEFLNEDVQTFFRDNEVVHRTGRSHKPTDQAIVERFNGTLKQRLAKRMTAEGTTKWFDVLDAVVHSLNNEVNRNIKITPQQAKDGVPVKPNSLSGDAPVPQKFQVGDRVRTILPNVGFMKGNDVRWSKEIYTVDRVYKVHNVYFAKVNGQKYQEEELQKIVDVQFAPTAKPIEPKPVTKRTKKELRELNQAPQVREKTVRVIRKPARFRDDEE